MSTVDFLLVSTSTSSLAFSVAGAVPAPGIDEDVPAHYGDPFFEQRALMRGEGVVDLSHRGVLTVEGPDRLTWLHSLSTQHLVDLQPGQSVENLILTPRGHIEFSLHMMDDGEKTWITTEPGAVSQLGDFLHSMVFLMKVNILDVTAEWAVIGDMQTSGASALTWVDPWPTTSLSGFRYNPIDDENHPGSEWNWRERLVPRGELLTHLCATERVPVGTWASEAARIAAWRPRVGVDTDHRTIPHELDLLRTAVHLNKGCYRGQETIARVKNLGKPPRRIVFLQFDGSEHTLPTVDSPLHLEGRVVGHVRSVARHYEMGPIGLGLVKRSIPVEKDLQAGEVAAAQEAIVQP